VIMKALSTMVAVSAVLFLLLTNAPTASARNGWGLEDPQLCVNGQLLTVVPAEPADVFVTVPKNAHVDYVVESCGGDSTVGVVPPGNVTFKGGNMLRVDAETDNGTEVAFTWNGQTVTDVAKRGEASAKFKTK
jgi:hypothetical protein